jgi:3-methyl-2-oxobutanoate hydroxymethyltransferase
MTAMTAWTASRIKAAKSTQKLSCLTAYDYSTARIVDDCGIQLILVGDSLAMTMLGYDTTLPATMDEMLHHTAAVGRAVRNALVVADMPFMSYQVSVGQALENAGRFVKEAGAGAVKIEGGAIRVPTVRALLENGIPVLGHIGLTPQSIRQMGGYRVQGKRPEQAEQLLEDARQLDKAGVFALVLECVPAALAAEITASVTMPTIGIGAGAGCDGQILVVHDMLGMYPDLTPKHAKQYANLGAEMKEAFLAYRREVEAGLFPADKHSF